MTKCDGQTCLFVDTLTVSRVLHVTIYSDNIFHTFALRSLHTLSRFSLCIEEFAHFVKLLAVHWKVLNILSFICAVQSWQICMVDKPAHFDQELYTLCIERLALLPSRHLRILHRGLHTLCIWKFYTLCIPKFEHFLLQYFHILIFFALEGLRFKFI